jgi:hypothetical protein
VFSGHSISSFLSSNVPSTALDFGFIASNPFKPQFNLFEGGVGIETDPCNVKV